LFDVPTMVIGIYVSHWVGNKKESVAGFAASMDWYVSSYYIDSVSKEMYRKFEFDSLFENAIKKFTIANKDIAPLRIIVYRDSESDLQNDKIYASEVPQLKNAILKCKTNGLYTEE